MKRAANTPSSLFSSVLQYAANAVVCLYAGTALLQGQAKPEFSFLHLTDLHLASDNNTYTHANSRLRDLVKEINSSKMFPLPDFVVVTGDIVHADPYSPDRARAELQIAKKYLDSLRMPYRVAIGTHENAWYPTRPGYDDPFIETFNTSTNYTFSFRGFFFVVLNSTSGYLYAGWPAFYGLVVNRRDFWLDSVLAANQDKRIFLFLHIPPVRPRPDAPDWTFDPTECGLERTINKYAANIIAVFAGHAHLNSRVTKNNVEYIVTSALASYPNQFKHIAVYPDSIVVMTYSTYPRNGSLWTGWKTPEYPSDTLYALGLTSERDFSIAIRSLRQEFYWVQRQGLSVYPNPFRSYTTVAYVLDNESDVEVSLFDILGRRVYASFRSAQSSGVHLTTIGASSFPAGVYFLSVRANGQARSYRLLLVR